MDYIFLEVHLSSKVREKEFGKSQSAFAKPKVFEK